MKTVQKLMANSSTPDFMMAALSVMTLLFLMAAKNEHADAKRVRDAQATAREAVKHRDRLVGQIEGYQNQIANHDDQIRGMTREVSEKDEENHDLRNKNSDLAGQLADASRKAERYEEQIEGLKATLDSRVKQIDARDKSIASRDKTIRGIRNQVADLNKENKNLRNQLADANTKVQGNTDQIASLQGQLDKVYADYAKQIAAFHALNTSFVKLQNQHRTLSQKRQSWDVIGLPGEFRRVGVVIDNSGSMVKQLPGLKELLRAWLTRLEFEHLYLLSFGSQPTVHTPSLKPATEANRAWAIEEIARLKADAGETGTLQALEIALPQTLDTLLLFTDGAPTDAPYTKILEDVRRLNQGRIVINTIALGDYLKEHSVVGYGTFLRLLAQQNRGKFLGL